MDELASLLKSARRESSGSLLEFVTEIFHRPDFKTQNPLHSLEGHPSARPTPGILAGSTPVWLEAALQQEDILGGFANRFVYVTGLPNPTTRDALIRRRSPTWRPGYGLIGAKSLASFLKSIPRYITCKESAGANLQPPGELPPLRRLWERRTTAGKWVKYEEEIDFPGIRSSMSVDLYRNQVASLTNDLAKIEDALAKERAREAKAAREIGKQTEAVARAGTESQRKSKLRRLEQEQQERARIQKKIADLEKRKASKLRDLQAKQRLLDQARKRETQRNRDAEIKHARNVRSEMEKAARLLEIRQYPVGNVADYLEQVQSERSGPMFTWLHLSDLHMKPTDWEQDLVIKNLLRDLPGILRESELKLDAILFTGDLANTGQASEFLQVERFLSTLCAVVELDPANAFFAVPGNHDVYRGRIPAIVKNGQATILGLKDCGKFRTEVGEILSSTANLEPTAARLHDYCDFVEHLTGRRSVSPSCPWHTQTMNIYGRSVGIACLCSAWACGPDEDVPGRIILGERQLRIVLDELGEPDFKIALLHHPVEWLHECERERIAEIFESREGFDLVLRGHLHNPRPTQTSLGRRTVSTGCGALYDTATRKGFQIGSFDFEQRNVSLRAFAYSEQSGGGFWHDDSSWIRGGSGNVVTFNLSALLTGGRRASDPTLQEGPRTLTMGLDSKTTIEILPRTLDVLRVVNAKGDRTTDRWFRAVLEVKNRADRATTLSSFVLLQNDVAVGEHSTRPTQVVQLRGMSTHVPVPSGETVCGNSRPRLEPHDAKVFTLYFHGQGRLTINEAGPYDLRFQDGVGTLHQTSFETARVDGEALRTPDYL